MVKVGVQLPEHHTKLLELLRGEELGLEETVCFQVTESGECLEQPLVDLRD